MDNDHSGDLMATPMPTGVVDGMETITVEGPEGFAPLVAAFAPILQSDGLAVWVTRWKLTPRERERLLAGDSLYVSVIAPVAPPVALTVGGPPIHRRPVSAERLE